MAATADLRVDPDQIVRLVSELIDIPSVTGSERHVAEFLVAHMREAGLEASLQEVEDGRANAIGRLRGTGGGATLAFSGHMDTATSGDPDEDRAGLGELGPGHFAKAYVKGGHVYGLGAVNMKGGVAAATSTVEALARAGTRFAGDVLCVWVCGESENAPVDGLLRHFRGARYRGGGVGTRYYVTHGQRPDYAVVCEPSNVLVTNCDTGYLFVKLGVKTLGGAKDVRAGAGMPGPVSGAISLIYHLIGALEAWKPAYHKKYAFPTGLGTMEPSVEIGAVESGWPYKPTYKPAVGNLYVTLRLSPAMTPSEPLGDLRALLDDLATRVPFGYDLEVYGSNVPSTVLAADHRLTQTALRARERVLGKAQQPLPSRYFGKWNDTNVFRQHGIPALILGPSWDDAAPSTSSGQAASRYDVGQHVAIDQLELVARMYGHIAAELCG